MFTWEDAKSLQNRWRLSDLKSILLIVIAQPQIQRLVRESLYFCEVKMLFQCARSLIINSFFYNLSTAGRDKFKEVSNCLNILFTCSYSCSPLSSVHTATCVCFWPRGPTSAFQIWPSKGTKYGRPCFIQTCGELCSTFDFDRTEPLDVPLIPNHFFFFLPRLKSKISVYLQYIKNT